MFDLVMWDILFEILRYFNLHQNVDFFSFLFSMAGHSICFEYILDKTQIYARNLVSKQNIYMNRCLQ